MKITIEYVRRIFGTKFCTETGPPSVRIRCMVFRENDCIQMISGGNICSKSIEISPSIEQLIFDLGGIYGQINAQSGIDAHSGSVQTYLLW